MKYVFIFSACIVVQHIIETLIQFNIFRLALIVTPGLKFDDVILSTLLFFAESVDQSINGWMSAQYFRKCLVPSLSKIVGPRKIALDTTMDVPQLYWKHRSDSH